MGTNVRMQTITVHKMRDNIYPTGYLPPGFTPPVPGTGGAVKGNMHVNSLLKTPQFWLLFTTSSNPI